MNCKYNSFIDCEDECDNFCIMNVLTELYFNKYGFMNKGWYEAFQKTELWHKAKELQIKERFKHGIVICELCKMIIDGNPILHHTEYDWGNFFFEKHIQFVHSECHEKWHQENELPKWINVPDKIHDMFLLNPNQEYMLCCWECDADYTGKPYQFLCPDCYWELKNEGITPNWRDYKRGLGYGM